jgi:cysteine-rich repeat protein
MPTEECDDGNQNNFDGCNSLCRVEPGFICAGGSTTSEDVCTPICGDGVRIDAEYSATLESDTLEECDVSGAAEAGCDPLTCKLTKKDRAGVMQTAYTCAYSPEYGRETCSPTCGDGIIVFPEECDDLNNVPYDGCSADCKVEPMYACTYMFGRSVCEKACGDGYLATGEECDDGNKLSGDGCSAECTLEDGFICYGGAPSNPNNYVVLASECKPICSDGKQVYGEECDDRNVKDGDGCDSNCIIEPGYYCSKAQGADAPSICVSTCGNGLVEPPEECDDADMESKRNAGFLVKSCKNCRLVGGDEHGDGRRGNGEECDDGNTLNGDGCNGTGFVELGWKCIEPPTYAPPGDSCTVICGDGLVLSPNEECDDGNLAIGDGCSQDCKVEGNYHCFNNQSTGYGLMGSYCIETVPPMMISAKFTPSYKAIEIELSKDAVSLDASNPDQEFFVCEVLIDNVDIMGTGPRCYWRTRKIVVVELGSDPTIVPGSRVKVKYPSLRTNLEAESYAPEHEVRLSASPAAPPQAVAEVAGPHLTSTCVSATILDATPSLGHAGREMTWYWQGMYALDEKGRVEPNETITFQKMIMLQSNSRQLVFVRRGFVYDLSDIDLNRTLNPGFTYRVNLTVTNLVGLSSTAVHDLKVITRPVPLVETAIARKSFRSSYNLWTELMILASVPPECLESPNLRLKGDLRTTWTHSGGFETGLKPINVTTYIRGVTPNRLMIPPRRLSKGPQTITASVCADIEYLLCGIHITCGNDTAKDARTVDPPEIQEVCSQISFRLDITASGYPSTFSYARNPSARRLSNATVSTSNATDSTSFSINATRMKSLADKARLQLISFPLEDDISGAPLVEDPVGYLQTLTNPAHSMNSILLSNLNWQWQGREVNPSATLLVAAVLRPPNDASESEKRALNWLRPRVQWALSGGNVKGRAESEPAFGREVFGGMFLAIEPEQLAFGTNAYVNASIALDITGEDACNSSVKSALVTLPVSSRPTAGELLMTVNQVYSDELIKVDLDQDLWVDAERPLKYRYGMQDGAHERLISDWSPRSKLTAYFMQRGSGRIILTGYVRNSLGVVANTSSQIIDFTGSEYKDIFLLSDYSEGWDPGDAYTSVRVTSLFQRVMTAVEGGAEAQMLILEDVVYSALAQRSSMTKVENCSADCGAQGECPKREIITVNGKLQRAPQVWTMCSCLNQGFDQRWIQPFCSRTRLENEVQPPLTLEVARYFRNILEGVNQTELDVSFALDTPLRLLGAWFRIVEDCRRVDLETVMIAAEAVQLILANGNVQGLGRATSMASKVIAALFACVPRELQPTQPKEMMPAPWKVFDEYLGRTIVCQEFGVANSKLCYDLVSQMITITCTIERPVRPYSTPIFKEGNVSNGTIVEEKTCIADLRLGLSDPYPCPCPVPEDTYVGMGRGEGMRPLNETLYLRDDHAIVWRSITQVMWNHSNTVKTNESQDTEGQAELSINTSLLLAALNSSTEHIVSNQTMIERTILAILSSAARMADVTALGMFPGQSRKMLSDGDFTVASEVALVSPPKASDDHGSALGSTKLTMNDVARIEFDFEVGNEALEAGGGGQIADFSITAPPLFIPVSGLVWPGKGGESIFSWLDNSKKLVSDVVQIRLSGTQGLTTLRYRFLVERPTLPGWCRAGRPIDYLITSCCLPEAVQAANSIQCPSPPEPPSPPPPVPEPPLQPELPEDRSQPGTAVHVTGCNMKFQTFQKDLSHLLTESLFLLL